MYVHSKRSPHHLSVMDAIALRDTLSKAIKDFDPAEAPMSMKEIPAEVREIVERVAEKHNMPVIDLLSRTRQWLAPRAEAIAEIKRVMKPKGWNTENIGWMFSRDGSTMRIHALRLRKGKHDRGGAETHLVDLSRESGICKEDGRGDEGSAASHGG